MASICFVAGDPSGDAHAARLIEALRAKDPTLNFCGLGGQSMQRAGLAPLYDLTQASAIGPFDALLQLGRLRHAKRLLEEHLRCQKIDLAILVDFGDFNLPVIAPLIKRHRVPIVYYISPQLWAWGRFRLRYVRRYIDRMVVLFPFEETFYKKAGVEVSYVGHPLVEEAKPSIPKEEAMHKFGLNPWRRTVGLLPGSREQEIKRHLPLMLEAAERISWHMPGVEFLLVKSPMLSRNLFDRYISKAKADVAISQGPIYDALQLMEAAMVTSGTATLEAALCEVPMAVVYKTSCLTYLGARALIRIPHIAMVNVLAQRELVPEFVQHRAAPKRIAKTMIAILRDDKRREEIKQGLRQVSEKLGPPGATDRAASVILEVLKSHVQ